MEIHLTPEQETRLAEIAKHQGVTVDAFVTDIALGLLEEDDYKREMIRRGLHQADQGIFIEEEEMDARVQAMLLPR
jgi:predicted transcriptional regulator